MNGYNFTERCRKVLSFARVEASALRHEHVDTEHILLEPVRDGSGVGYAILENLAGDTDSLQQRLRERMAPPGDRTPVDADLPYTSRAKKALELAMTEAQAQAYDHSYIGTEHLLLGIAQETSTVASQMLAESGVDVAAARAEMMRLLGSPPEAGNAQNG